MRRMIGLVLLALLVASCSSTDHSVPPPTTIATGVAVGYMHITGGRPRTNGKTTDQPLAGVVQAIMSRDFVVGAVTVDRTGRFRMKLPPGNYYFRGRPANSGLMAIQSAPLKIKVGQTTNVDLVEYAN